MSEGLRRRIQERISSSGPITFYEFMEAALYDPEDGYYLTRAPGPDSDFRTAPSLTPRFGALLARWLEAAWKALGSPDSFRVVEVGPGAGDLAAGATDASSGAFADALSWTMVERSPTLRSLQHQRLQGSKVPLEWADDFSSLKEHDGCVIANEVIDNFPVHLLEVGAGRLAEVGVGVAGDRLVEVLLQEGGDVEALAADALDHLSPGDRLEERPQVSEWLAGAFGALRRGWLLAIDYGDTRPDIWTTNPQGTLTGYREERLIDDLLADPGHSDITAHVDFTHLSDAARETGFTVPEVITQEALLGWAGIEDATDGLKRERERAMAARDYEGAAAAMAEQSRLAVLTAPWSMGDFPAMLAAKNAPVLPPWK